MGACLQLLAVCEQKGTVEVVPIGVTLKDSGRLGGGYPTGVEEV